MPSRVDLPAIFLKRFSILPEGETFSRIRATWVTPKRRPEVAAVLADLAEKKLIHCSYSGPVGTGVPGGGTSRIGERWFAVKYPLPDMQGRASYVPVAVRRRRLLEDQAVLDIRRYLRENPPRPVLGPRPPKKSSKAQSHEMLLLFSDAHYPEVVNPDEAMGLSYDAEIAQRRFEYIRDTVIRYKDLRSTSYPVRKLTVAGLGDLLSGSIHEEIEITNQFPVTEALVRLAYIMNDLGTAWASEFPEVEMIFLCGNHPRLTKKPRHKAKWDNWDYVLGKFVEALATGYKVTVPKSLLHVHQVFDKQIGMVHGDGVKSASFAGIPWYGMKSRRDSIQALLSHLGRPRIDYLLMGHFHQPLYWAGTDCDLIINGSVKGGDEYVIDTRHTSTAPVQLLTTFHPEHGLTDISRINLQKVV